MTIDPGEKRNMEEHWAKISPCPAVQNYIASDWDSEFCFLHGPVGSAKTVATIQKMMLIPEKLVLVNTHEKYGKARLLRALVCCNTLKAYRNTFYKTFFNFFPGIMRLGSWGTAGGAPVVHWIGTDGIRNVIEITPLGLAEKGSEEKIRGGDFDVAFINEFTPLLQNEDGFWLIYTRVGRPLSGKQNMKQLQDENGKDIPIGRIYGDTNPPPQKPLHWFYKMFPIATPALWNDPDNMKNGVCMAHRNTPLRRCYYIPDQLKAIELGHGLANPAQVPAFYEGKKHLPPAKFQEFVGGTAPSNLESVAVYSSFNSSEHCVEYEPDPRSPIYAGGDTDHYGGFVIGQFNLETKQFVIIDGIRADNENGIELARSFMETWQIEYFGYKFNHGWMDPAGASRQVGDGRSYIKLMQKEYDNAGHEFPLSVAPVPHGIRPNSARYRFGLVNQLLSERLSFKGLPAVVVAVKGGAQTRVVRAQRVAQAMANYRYPINTNKEISTHPIKDKMSGLADAVAYLCMGLELKVLKKTRKRVRPLQEFFPAGDGTFINKDGEKVVLPAGHPQKPVSVKPPTKSNNPNSSRYDDLFPGPGGRRG